MGEIVARGAIKVDARKARDKLRDHLLPDLHLYATEIARAAIALGASRLDLDYDADDAIFTFDRSLPLELLVSIRDHVLAPAGEDAPRLLGIAVNAALGLRPSFVDLIRAEGGRCMRVRFRGDDDPVTSEVKPSRGMIPDGLRVHFRRAPGLETLGRLVNRELLPEVALLIATTHDAPIAVMHEGKSVGRPQSRAVLRLDIDEPALKRTFIEISGPGPRAQTDFLEHGVRLVTHETVFGAWVHRRMPIRLVVDAKRLPTNASRSELRVDAELLQRLAQKTPVALERALAEIVARREEPAVEEALGAIAAQVVLLIRQGTKVPAPLRELLDLPLMRDAIGRPLAPRSLPQNAFFVYRGEEALPGSLAPWLAGVPWDRGRAIDACFAEIPHRPADNVVALALAAHERRARALSHPASPPALGVGTYSIRHAFDIALGPFAGLKGEVALAPRGTLALARFFVESRLIETRPLPGVTLPLAIALEWPNRIRPKFTYDGVEMDATVTQAIVFALRSAALLIARETKDLDLARLAIVAAHSASHDLGDKNLGALTEVDALPVWPITTGRLVSTATLAAYAAKKGAICAGPSGSGPAVDDRPVVENAWVADVCRMFGGIPSIPYGRFLPPQQGGMNAEAAHHRIVVWFDRDGAHGFVAPGRGKMLFHAGQFIGRLPLERPFLVVVDDRHAVPGVGAHVPWTSPLDLAKEEHELVARVLDRCEREENPQLAEWLAELPQMDEVLRNRIVALPRRMALRKKNEARDALLARPIDIPKVVPTAQPHARVQRAGNRAILALAPSTWTEGRVEIFFRDHSIGVAEVKRWKVIVRADLADETLFDDSFAALEAVGNSTVAALVDDGVVGLAKVLVALESFPFDEAAIGFVRKVVEVSRRDIRDAVGSASWPTVQGGRTKLHEGPNSYGRERYATYRMADETSPYDAPALLLSEPATRLLKVLGFELTDVTEPIARLQTRRSRGLASRPRLEGPASAFRRTLEELGATTCDGEIELVPEPSQTEVRHVDERGISRLMDMSVPFPLRAVFRGDSEEDVRNAAHALAFAIPMHDAVPFVLTAKRIAMCQKGIQEAHLDMEVWPDNTGRVPLDSIHDEQNGARVHAHQSAAQGGGAGARDGARDQGAREGPEAAGRHEAIRSGGGGRASSEWSAGHAARDRARHSSSMSRDVEDRSRRHRGRGRHPCAQRRFVSRDRDSHDASTRAAARGRHRMAVDRERRHAPRHESGLRSHPPPQRRAQDSTNVASIRR